MSSAISAAQNGSNDTIIGRFGLSVGMEKPCNGDIPKVIQRSIYGYCEHVRWAHPFSVCIICNPELMEEIRGEEE